MNQAIFLFVLLPALSLEIHEHSVRLPGSLADFFVDGPMSVAPSQPNALAVQESTYSSRRLGSPLTTTSTPSPGWIYVMGYAGLECNYGQPLIIRSQITNICLQSDTVNGQSRSYYYTCDSPNAHVQMYNGTSCDGTPIQTTLLTMDSCTPPAPNPDEVPYSFYSQCSTSSSNPFSNAYSYVSLEFANDNQCGQILSYHGELNDACIPKNLTFAVKPAFPDYYVYDNFFCQETPTNTYTLNQSCIPRQEPPLAHTLSIPAENFQRIGLVTGSISSSSSNGNGSTISTGALAGIVVGSVVGAFLIAGLLYYFLAFKSAKSISMASQQNNL